MFWNRVNRHIRAKLDNIDEAGMGYWVVRATLRDGREYRNVCITDSHVLGFPDLSPFRAGDIMDIGVDAPRGNSGTPVLVSTPPTP